jgi:preprotein translocase subunit SecD
MADEAVRDTDGMRGIRGLAVVWLIMITAGCGLIPTLPAPTPRGLSEPLAFHQVIETTAAPCPSAGHGRVVPDPNDPQTCLVLGPSRLTVDRLEQVRVETDQAGQSVVQFRLPPEAVDQLAALTAELTDRPDPTNRMALILGPELIMAPAVQGAITDGEVQIAGNFTRGEADALSKRLGG